MTSTALEETEPAAAGGPAAVNARVDLVALSNADEGFADAVARWVLQRPSKVRGAP
jgi:hypothetical protein